MLNKAPWLAKVLVFGSVGLYVWSSPSSANFYTVIGPDGRPIVIQDQSKPKPKVISPNTVSVTDAAPIQEKTVSPNAAQAIVKQPVVLKETIEKPVIEKRAIEKSVVEQQAIIPPTAHVSTNTQVAEEKSKADQVIMSAQEQLAISQVKVDTAKLNEVKIQQKQAQMASPEVQKVVPAEPILSEAKVIPVITQPSQPKQINAPQSEVSASIASTSAVSVPTQPQAPNPVVEIDGVQYVNSEYLEQREFNLEGKKRFYVMPEAGSGAGHNVHTIEREKGVSKSVLDRLWKKDDEPKQAVVLSMNYQRLGQEEVVEALEQRCFQGNKLTKAKTLGAKNSDLGYWPVAPIKEKFAYEVTKLEPAVNNILLTSYASSKKTPQYYWPFIVFLDAKGCVVEGVSGFKTAKLEENMIHQARIEGVLRKPNNAVYLFMTPLESALDLENVALSNQGQIKLTIIE